MTADRSRLCHAHPSEGLLLGSSPSPVDRAKLDQWLTALGLSEGVRMHALDAPGARLHCHLAPEYRQRHLPKHNTLHLHTHWRTPQGQPPTLEQETLLALLAAPHALQFESLAALQSHVRVRCHMAQAATKTALAFKTQAAERPEAFWHYDEAHGFLLKPGCDLRQAIVAATQPEATGRLYDFSCYRASEYVILLGIAMELHDHHPELYEQLQTTCRQHAIRSGQFHEVFLIEYGSMQEPLPMHYYVPGDRLWFRNPDAHSSDVEGYEGSWVIYMGRGLFSNFWRRDEPFTLESKCLEVFHWRDGTYRDADGQLQMDESRVALAVHATRQDPARVQAILQRMMRLRDPQGVYAEGGCIDATREFARSVSPDHCELVLPQFSA